jgi:hypothetical protein
VHFLLHHLHHLRQEQLIVVDQYYLVKVMMILNDYQHNDLVFRL